MENEHITQLLERLQRDSDLRAWVLTAPTRALATLGVVLDDNEQVLLLEQIEALDVLALPLATAANPSGVRAAADRFATDPAFNH
jgi:hypothetical protein